MRTKTAIISIENLTKEALPKLAAALKAVPGVGTVDFSIERSVAVLDFDPSQSHIDDFLRAVLQAGFKVL
ncbi:MAG: heavy-metal-associated domain-containing protein [Deltaproteobacteria bacterium]|nr:heavy-metal-associated domain-containing protein [Deltaproteobacteria bacterium]